MSRRKLKRRLLWAGLFLGLSLLALAGIIVRAVGAVASAARQRNPRFRQTLRGF